MITREQVKKIIEKQIMTTSQACQYLDVTRQNRHLASRTGRLEPLYQTNRETLYWRKDIEEYKRKYSRKK